MPVPGTQEICKPLLEFLRDGEPHSLSFKDIGADIAEYFGEDINEMSSSDKSVFKTRVKAAKMYLKKYGLLYSPSYAAYKITSLGKEVFEDAPEVINEDYLSRFDSMEVDDPLLSGMSEVPVHDDQSDTDDIVIEGVDGEESEIDNDNNDDVYDDEDDDDDDSGIELDESPSETSHDDEPDTVSEPELRYAAEAKSEVAKIEDILNGLNRDLAEEILAKVAEIPSDKFEQLVIDLLSKMGYQAFHNARYTPEVSGDNCIHGVILEDKKGLSPIYIQVRKLAPNKEVKKVDIQDFIDVISNRGGKGLFATTASFSEAAAQCAKEAHLMLIDGDRLAQLMIARNFCVSVEKVLEIKAIDGEGFSEYEV